MWATLSVYQALAYVFKFDSREVPSLGGTVWQYQTLYVAYTLILSYGLQFDSRKVPL